MRFQSLLLLPEICWMGETSVFSQATAFPRAAAHSIFLVMDCGRSSVPIPLDLPSAFDALDQEIFFLWHFWLPVGLKRFAPSSLLGSSWSCMKSIHLSRCKCRKSRNAFKEGGCEPSSAARATSFLTCCFYFSSTPFQLTLIWSQTLHIKTGVLRSSWQTLLPAVTSAGPVLLPHRHGADRQFQRIKLFLVSDPHVQGK